MEDFLNGYIPGKTHCPLTLLLNFRENKSETIDLILADESLHGIFDVNYISKVQKTISNPSLREEAYGEIERLLLNVSKEYVQANAARAKENDAVVLDLAHGMDCGLDDYSGPDAIIEKVKKDKVLLEFLPQALTSLSVDLKDVAENTRLSFINKDQIKEVIHELSVLHLVLDNIYSIIDNKEILEKRFEEKKDKIKSILVNIGSIKNNIELTDCTVTNFMTINSVIKDLHFVIRDSFEAMASLKEEDLFKLSDFASEVVIMIEKNELSRDDIEVMERAIWVKHLELSVYNSLINNLKTHLEEFNLVHEVFNKVLNKVNL